MITSEQITRFLSKWGNESRQGGLLEELHDMLVAARNELQRYEREVSCVHGPRTLSR